MTTATSIPQLNPNRPLGSEDASTSDDYHREIRRVLLNTFPNLGGAVNLTPDQLNELANATADAVAGAIVKRTATGNIAGDITGNAPTADRLATPRQIAGQAFDGTADIEIPPDALAGVSQVTAADINKLVNLARAIGSATIASRLATDEASIANLEAAVPTIPAAATAEQVDEATADDVYVSPATLATVLPRENVNVELVRTANTTTATLPDNLANFRDIYVEFDAGEGTPISGLTFYRPVAFLPIAQELLFQNTAGRLDFTPAQADDPATLVWRRTGVIDIRLVLLVR